MKIEEFHPIKDGETIFLVDRSDFKVIECNAFSVGVTPKGENYAATLLNKTQDGIVRCLNADLNWWENIFYKKEEAEAYLKEIIEEIKLKLKNL